MVIIWGSFEELYTNADVHAYVLSLFNHVWLSVTLWSVALQASLSMRFSRQEHWSRIPCPPPGDLPDPEMEPAFPSLQEHSLPTSHLGIPEMLIPGPKLISIEWNLVGVGPRYRCFWKIFSKDLPMHLGLRTTALKHLKFNLLFYGWIAIYTVSGFIMLFFAI